MRRNFAICIVALALALAAVPVAAQRPTPTVSSAEVEVVTAAQVPGLRATTGTAPGRVRLVLDPKRNPDGTEYAVRELSTGGWVDPFDGALLNVALWGNFSRWGGVRGVEVEMGRSAETAAFSAVARNRAGEVTDASPPAALGGLYKVRQDFFSSALIGVTVLLGLAVFVGLTSRERLRERGAKRHRSRR